MIGLAATVGLGFMATSFADTDNSCESGYVFCVLFDTSNIIHNQGVKLDIKVNGTDIDYGKGVCTGNTKSISMSNDDIKHQSLMRVGDNTVMVTPCLNKSCTLLGTSHTVKINLKQLGNNQYQATPALQKITVDTSNAYKCPAEDENMNMDGME